LFSSSCRSLLEEEEKKEPSFLPSIYLYIYCIHPTGFSDSTTNS
jgi:hypothetical protein